MCKNIKTSVKTDGERSKEFDMKLEVHQGSVLCPLLFAVAIDEAAKEVRESGVKELLCAAMIWCYLQMAGKK